MSDQQQPQPRQPAYQAQPPAPPKKKHRLRWVFGLGGVILLIIVIVSVNSSSDGGDTADTPAEGQPAEAPVTEPAEPAEPVEPESVGPATTITGGVYEVGVDVQPGQYKTPGPPEDDLVGSCYWARLKDDSGSFDALIANGNLEGPGSVTIKAGEFFEATGECTWTMVG